MIHVQSKKALAALPIYIGDSRRKFQHRHTATRALFVSQKQHNRFLVTMVWDGGLGMLLKAISFAVKWFKNVKNAPKLIKDLLSQLQVVEDELTRDDIAINQDDVVKQALRHPDAKLKMSLALAERTFKQVDERLEAIFVLMNLKSYKKVWGFIDARIIPGLDPQLVMSKQKELSEMMLALVRASDAYGRHIGLITA